ncbi:UDP-glucose 4-epimerase family protein [Hydrogenophaga sp.]
MKKLALTGSSGFVGGTLMRRLLGNGTELLTIGHRAGEGVQVTYDTLTSTDDVSRQLSQCDALVHAGARVHVMNEVHQSPLLIYREVNVQKTLSLAQKAASCGIRRFIFVSSVKVNGESTEATHPFTAHQAPAPLDPYGISKMEAEDGLRQIARETGMEVVVVRPPLVYGPGVKANFAALMRAVQRGLPLPLGAVTHNRRSLVALDNLVDLLITCIDHPAAANQTFLVSDGEDLSTTDLLRRMSRAMNVPARLLPVPPALLKLGAGLMGKRDMAQRLLGSLQVDITHTRETLGWAPPISVDEGLRRAAAGMVKT